MNLKEGSLEKALLLTVLIIILAVIFVITGKDEPAATTALLNQDNNSEPVTAKATDNSEIGLMEKELEEKLTQNLEKMKGVGKVRVLVRFDSSLLKDYASDKSVTKKTSKETDQEGGTRETVEVTENNQLVVPGNNEPVVVVEQRPQISGVLIIAQGADDPKIKEQIFQSVRVLLNIQPSKISVTPMEGV